MPFGSPPIIFRWTVSFPNVFSSPNTRFSTSVYKQFEWIDEDPSLWTTQIFIQLLRNPPLSTSLDQQISGGTSQSLLTWKTNANCLQEKIRKLGTHTHFFWNLNHPSCCSNICRAFLRAITVVRPLERIPKAGAARVQSMGPTLSLGQLPVLIFFVLSTTKGPLPGWWCQPSLLPFLPPWCEFTHLIWKIVSTLGHL